MSENKEFAAGAMNNVWIFHSPSAMISGKYSGKQQNVGDSRTAHFNSGVAYSRQENAAGIVSGAGS